MRNLKKKVVMGLLVVELPPVVLSALPSEGHPKAQGMQQAMVQAIIEVVTKRS